MRYLEIFWCTGEGRHSKSDGEILRAKKIEGELVVKPQSEEMIKKEILA